MSNHQATPDRLESAQNQAVMSNPIHGRDIAIMLGLLISLCFIVFHKFVLGNAVYLFKDIGSDTVNAFYPSFTNISQLLRESGIPGWSFEQGLGQNVFPFSLSDPTTYLLYLLGSDNLSFGIIWVEIFKIIGSGLLFFCFLKKLKVDTHAAYLGGMLYAFSGFMIVGGGWYVFSTLGLYVAMILLSFEMLYTENRWWLFPVSVALLAAYNLVSLYTCSLFLLLYVLLRTYSEPEINVKKLASTLRNLILLGTLGLLVSSVLSLPNLMQMVGSTRVSGDASHVSELASMPVFQPGNTHYLFTLLMRTFSSDLLGNGSDYKGWDNYLETPMSYCGLISLMLVPQLFSMINNRKRIVYGALLGLFMFAEIFPWFRRGFWLFLGDYFRDYSLYVSIIFILFAALALDKVIRGGGVNRRVLAASFFTLLILLFFPYDFGNKIGRSFVMDFSAAIDHGIQAEVALFLTLILAGLIFISIGKYRRYAQYYLLAVVFLELASFSYTSVNKREVVTSAELQQKVGYNDYSVDALAYIKQQDNSFFRVEKNYGSAPAKHVGMNDSKVQHYFGSSSYHSFNQLSYINFLSSCGAVDSRNDFETRSALGVKEEPLLQILTGVKYLLVKGDWRRDPSLLIRHAEIGTFGDVTVLKSRFALPMGVAYDTYISQSDFNKLNKNRRQIALLRAVMVPDNLVSELSGLHGISENEIPGDAYSYNELASDTNKLKQHRLRMGHFSNSSIEGEINTLSNQLVFFSIPYDSGWKAKVNGVNANIIAVDGGLSAILVGPGNNVISLRYTPPFVAEGFFLTLLGLIIFGVAVFRFKSRLTMHPVPSEV